MRQGVLLLLVAGVTQAQGKELLPYAWKIDPRIETIDGQAGGLPHILVPGATIRVNGDWALDTPGTKWAGTQGWTGKWRRLVGDGSRPSVRRPKRRDLYAVEAMVRETEDESERAGLVDVVARTFGAEVSHAWRYQEFVGEGLDKSFKDWPVFQLVECVELSVGHGPGRDLAPRSSTQFYRAMLLFSGRAEVHYLGTCSFVEVRPDLHRFAPGNAPNRNRVRERSFHVIVAFERGAVTVETTGQKARWHEDPIFELKHLPWKRSEPPVDGRREHHLAREVPVPESRHVLVPTIEKLETPVVWSVADWDAWMTRGRGRTRPEVLVSAGLVAETPFRVGSWISLEKKGRKTDVRFKCPLGIEVSTEDDAVFSGIPALRALVIELETHVFAKAPLTDKKDAALQPEKVRQ